MPSEEERKPLVLIFTADGEILSNDNTLCELQWVRKSYLCPFQVVRLSNPQDMQAQLELWHDTGRLMRDHHTEWWIYSARAPYGLLGRSDKCGLELIQEELRLTAGERNGSSS